MVRERYYFSNCSEDGDLSEIAVKAKKIVQQIDDVINIFRINNEKLYGSPPRNVLAFLQQNNKSIISPGNESNPNVAKSYEGMPTTSQCNPDTSNMSRKYFTLGEAEKKEHHSATLAFSTQIRQPTPVLQPAVEMISNTTIDETGINYEQFSSQVGSKDDQEASFFAEIDMTSINLTLEQAQIKEHHSATLEFNTQIGQPTPVLQPAVEMIPNTTIEETGINYEQFSSQVGSKDDQEASFSAEIDMLVTHLANREKEFASPSKAIDSNNASNLRSPSPIKISKILESIMETEKQWESQAKQVGSVDANYQEIPESFEASAKKVNLAMAEKASKSPTKEVGKIKLEEEEIPRSSDIITTASSLTEDDKESRNLIRSDQVAGHSAANKDFSNPEKNAGKSKNTNYIIVDFSKVMDILIPSLIDETHKRTKICSIPTIDIQACFNPSKKGKRAENSLEDTKVTVSPIARAELNVSLIETLEGISREDRKRKSLSPARRSATLFKSVPRIQVENSPEDTKKTASRTSSGAHLNKTQNETIIEIARDDRKRKSLTPRKSSTAFLKSMPRVIKLAEDKIAIEVDLNYEANPRASRSKSADYRSDSTKYNVKSPAVGKLKTDTSSKAPERYCGQSQRMSLIESSCNISRTYNPVSDDNVYARKNPSNLSIKAPEPIDLFRKIEIFTVNIEDHLSLLNETIMKFHTLFAERDRFVKNSFVPFQKFQSSITFIISYVREVLHFISKLDNLDKCSTDELENIVRVANAIADKLIFKLQPWEKDVGSVILTCYECIQQSEQLKAQNGPFFSDEGELAITFKALQIYEREMQAIWKKMYDMIMQVEAMRVLFSYIAFDVERLTIMLVKCFTLVRILKLR